MTRYQEALPTLAYANQDAWILDVTYRRVESTSRKQRIMPASTTSVVIAPAVPTRHSAEPANGLWRLRAVWHNWRLRRARSKLLDRAADLEGAAPSFAADLRAAVEVR